jgi:HK97 family phage prohead protease
VTTTAVTADTAAHEARHAAAALLLGLDVREARADNPNPEMGGYVELGPYTCLQPRESGIMTPAGRWGDPGWPPESPSKSGRTFDERNLADDVETLNRGHAGYLDMVADTERLVERPEFKSLTGVLEPLLAAGCVLREDHIRLVHESCGKPELNHKAVKATTRVGTDLGEFSALAAAWSPDRDGDQIVRGAFARSIERWQASGKRVPLHYNHSANPKDIIGSVEPASMRETREGLFVRGKVDLDRSETARDVWRLVKSNTISLSFGYLVTDAFKRADGIQELRELDLFEVSLTPVPANPDTRIVSFKSTDPPESEVERERVIGVYEIPRDPLSPGDRRLRDQARDEMYALLTAPLESDPEVVLEREEKRQARELRRQCDRLRLEAALGFDQDLIDKLDL